MSITADQIIHEARALPAEERARVAEEVLRTLDSPEQTEIDAAWAKEAEDRLRRYEAGETTAIDADGAIEDVRRKLLR